MRTPQCSPAAKTTVIIPNWNGMSWLGPCLEALRQTVTDFQTIIVDNGSSDDSVAFIKAYPEIEIVELGTNTGFATAANIGIAKAETPYIALLNSDTRPHPDWLSSLTETIERSPPEIAAINSQLLRLDDPERIDDAGDELSWYGAATKRGHNEPASAYQQEAEIFSPCAAACLYRRDFLLKTGGFDEDMFAYLEDVDLGLRGRQLGYRYVYCPQAKVLHKGHGAGMPDSYYVEVVTRNRLLLFVKNIPARLLVRHAAEILYGQLYFLLLHRRPWSSLKGYMSFIRSLRSTMNKRRSLLSSISVDLKHIDAMLQRGAPQPFFRKLFAQLLFGGKQGSSNLFQNKLVR